MEDKASFCPACGHTHKGFCEAALARLAATKSAKAQEVLAGSCEPDASGPRIGCVGPAVESGVASPAPIAPASETPSPKIEAAQAKFDKTAYQREYMRKKREAAKAKK